MLADITLITSPADLVRPREQDRLALFLRMNHDRKERASTLSEELNPPHTVHLPTSPWRSVVHLELSHTPFHFFVVPLSPKVSQKNWNFTPPVHLVVDSEKNIWLSSHYGLAQKYDKSHGIKAAALWSNQASFHSNEQERLIYKMKSQRLASFFVAVVLH